MSVGRCSGCAVCCVIVRGVVAGQLRSLPPGRRSNIAAEALALANQSNERDALQEKIMTRRESAARELGQLLTTDIVGRLLDEIGDAGLRDLVLKAAAAARDVAVDAAEAEAMGERQRVHGQAGKHLAPAPPRGQR